MKPDNCPDVTEPLASALSISSSEMVGCRAAMQRARDEMRYLNGRRLRVDVASYAMTAIQMLDKAIQYADDAIEKEKAANDESSDRESGTRRAKDGRGERFAAKNG